MNDKDTDPPDSGADKRGGPPERRQATRRSYGRRASDVPPSGLPATADELKQLVGQIVAEERAKAPGKSKVKQPTGDQALPRTDAKRVRRSNKRIVAVAAVLVALAAVPVAWKLWPRTAEIPDGMVGLWTTDDPRYVDRAFRVTKTTLTFHVGPQDSTHHPIVRVRAKKGDVATQFTVYYTQSGLEVEFPILYVDLPDTRILLLNQREMIWRKVES